MNGVQEKMMLNGPETIHYYHDLRLTTDDRKDLVLRMDNSLSRYRTRNESGRYFMQGTFCKV